MRARAQDILEFRDLPDGVTTVVTVHEECLGDETVVPLRAQLREGLADRIASGRRTVVLNLGEVAMADSCGLAAIISTKRQLDSAGARLALTNLSDLLQRLFHLTRLDRVIEIHETEAEAIADL